MTVDESRSMVRRVPSPRSVVVTVFEIMTSFGFRRVPTATVPESSEVVVVGVPFSYHVLHLSRVLETFRVRTTVLVLLVAVSGT